MTNQITLDVAKIAMCAVETVLRKTSPYAADYPQLVEQSRSSSSTQPVSMLNLQALSSYFMFVSFLPYGTLTVVTFVTRFF